MPRQQIQILTPAAQDVYKAAWRVVAAVEARQLPENGKQIAEDASKVYQRVDQSVIPDDLSSGLLYAVRALRARMRGVEYPQESHLAQVYLRKYTLPNPKKARRESAQAAKKARRESPQEPRVDRKRLEEYAQNFKEAQLSLDLRRPMNERGWVQQKQPTTPMQVIRGRDDRMFGLWISDADKAHVEKRDAEAIRDWAEGYRPPCPITKYEIQRRGDSKSFSVVGYVQNKYGDWNEVGHLDANYTHGTRDGYISGYANVPIATLAACPGLGNGLYLAAANEACRRGGRLMSSDYRSIFSEHFWKKQIEKKRATCDLGGSAGVYHTPALSLRKALLDGEITVPQYNAMRGRVPEYPEGDVWDCENVVLNDSWCKTPKKDRTLRGLRGRGRYRLTSGRG